MGVNIYMDDTPSVVLRKLPPVRKALTTSEREQLNNIITGKADINTNKARRFLDKSHIAITLEAILDRSGLTDTKLARRLNEIITRKNRIVTEDGKEIIRKGGKEQVSIDANALNGIRLAWQVKGKFTEKHELKMGLNRLSDEQLDDIINSGMEFIYLKKNRIENNVTDN